MAGYTRGLHEVGDGTYAWLQPDGSWGWSNAGLVVDGDASLLVDTLFDLRLTEEMLGAMRRATAAAGSVDVVVNTHSNGDHTFGNRLVRDARIVSSARCAEEMARESPDLLAGLLRAAPGLGPVGEYLQRIFGPFAFDGIELTLPTETFSGELTLHVGDRVVRLHEVGPAHTGGDVLVDVPDARLVFTGDICFVGGHPVVWAGPVANWIAALDRIAAMDVDVVVPGHGPVAGKAQVAALRGYLEHVWAEAAARHAAGLSPLEAARDIDLGAYAGWGDAERLVVNVTAVYRELGATVADDRASLFAQMAELAGYRAAG